MTHLIDFEHPVPHGRRTITLAPELRTLPRIQETLDRFARVLEDRGWRVVVESISLGAEKHPGLRYRTLSILDRATRGSVAAWANGDGLHVAFAPDWTPAVIEALALAVVGRWVVNPYSGDLFWNMGELAVAFVLFLPLLFYMMRIRLADELERAAWLSDEDWELTQERAEMRRHLFKWLRRIGLGCLASAWTYKYWTGTWYVARIASRQHPLLAGVFALTALAAGALTIL